MTTHQKVVSKPRLPALSALRESQNSGQRGFPSEPDSGPSPHTNRKRKQDVCVRRRQGGVGYSYPLRQRGPQRGHICRRTSEHPTQRSTFPRSPPTRAGTRLTQGALTRSLIAREVDDAHPLEAGAARVAPEIYQGEVSV